MWIILNLLSIRHEKDEAIFWEITRDFSYKEKDLKKCSEKVVGFNLKEIVINYLLIIWF
ncbi:MAG: hypothetical protein NTX96_01475 [Candidatus Zambryskibacteria bacterium]|nr:hypothetical protein [Candidatus Zambryskibacteria bacterium]